MKIYKSLLFIICCTAMVASIAFVFPNEGIVLGPINFRYADADKFLYPPAEPTVDLHKEAQAITDAKKIRIFIAEREHNEFKARQLKLTAMPYAIDLPHDNVKWMDSVFMAMEQGEDVRIVHYGDSQIEEDRMSSTFRYRFQKLFGGYGAGLLPPLQTIPSSAIAQRSNGYHERFVVFGTSSMQHEYSQYGPMGQMIETEGEYTTSFFPINLWSTKENTKKMKKVAVLYGNNKTELTISLIAKNASDSIEFRDTIEVKDSIRGMEFARFEIPFVAKKVTLSVNGETQLYGYLLDGDEKGVQLDNVAMRGCSGTIFTKIARESLDKYYKEYNVPLIIMQFGGNSVPYLKGKGSIDRYCRQLLYQINHIRTLSPKSKILFIGPSDMGTSIDGTMQTYPELPNIISAIKHMCVTNDVAYWDLYSAMGGHNSMLAWVAAEPALAGSDHIHFTRIGAEKAAALLCEHVEELYKYYKERQSSNIIVEKKDTIVSLLEDI